MQDVIVNEPTRQEARTERNLAREDTQQFRQDQLSQNLTLKREELKQRATDAQQRSEDTNASIEQRRDAAREAVQARRELAALVAGNRQQKVVPLPNAVHKELSAAEDAAANIASLKDTFKPEYSGFGQGISNTVSAYNPFSEGSDANKWWKDYAKRSSLEEAHRLFGASFTAPEQARWQAADISPGMNSKTIQDNLSIRADIANRMFTNSVNRYKLGGYPNVDQVFVPNAPRSTGSINTGGASRSSGNAVTVRSAADYAKVPSGATYTDPQGVTRTKP